MGRFNPQELAERRCAADAARAAWSGSYPWRQCAGCYAQLDVGGVTLCGECRAWENRVAEIDLQQAIRSTASQGTYDEAVIRKAVSFELAEAIVGARAAMKEAG